MVAVGRRRGLLLVLVMLVALVGAGCGSDEPSDTGAQGGGGTSVSGLVTDGTLTVGTELPAPPFWIGENYDSITGGFEVDLAKELAKRLNQGILVKKGTKVSSMAEAKNLQWGAQQGTTGAIFISETIKPTTEARLYDRTVDAFTALSAGQIQAVLLDTPIVLGAVKEKQVPDGEVVGQFKTGEQYGAVVNRDSPNLDAFNTVIKQLKSEGFIDQLLQKYFSDQVDVPVIS